MSAVYLKQVGFTFVVRILSVLISLIYVPLVLGYLNQEKYGIWLTLTTVVNWIRLFDVGIGNGMRNKLAEAIAMQQTHQGRAIISTTYVVLGSIFVGVLAVFLLLNPLISWQWIVNSTIITNGELVRLMTVVVSFIVIGFILQPVSLVYAAHGNSSAGGLIQLLISLVSLVLIWLVSIYGAKGNIYLLAWIITGVPVIIYFLVTLYTFIYRYPKLCPSFKLSRLHGSGDLFHLSAQFFVVQITATVLFSSIPFVVAQLFNPNMVTIFNIANTIYNLPIMVISLITAPLLPLVTQAYAKRDYHWITSMLNRMKIISLCIASGTILMTIVSPFIYKLWIGGKVLIPMRLSVAICVYTIINVMVNPYSVVMNGIGRIRILVLLAPVGIVMFITLSIVLTKLLNDVVSISIALSLTSIVGLIVLPREIKKQLHSDGC